MNILYTILDILQVIEYRSGIYICVQMRHVLYIKYLYRHSAGRPVLRYFCTVTKWSVCIIIPLSDVTNSEHKLRQFSLSQTMYLNDHRYILP